MDIEQRLQRLQERYRRALSEAVGAKAEYFALACEPSATADSVQRAAARWQQIKARKRSIAASMRAMEQLVRSVAAGDRTESAHPHR
jgi:hypothetical protein